MRKVASVLILLCVVSSGVFAQKTTEDLDGYDWVTWTIERKCAFVQGYYSACIMMMYMSLELNQPTMSKEQLSYLFSQLENQFSYSDTVGGLATRLDDFYAAPATRKFVLYRTIPYLAGKEWWNRNTGKVDPLSKGDSSNGSNN